MIIAGDVALARKGMNLSLPDSLSKEFWLVNLEGTLVKKGEKYIPLHGVFNDYNAIRELKSKINIKVLSLANNHILDAENIGVSLDNAKEMGIPTIGAGYDINDSKRSFEIEGFTVVSFGWECIECPQATLSKNGVNPYRKSNVISTIKPYLADGRKVVCYFHWNYEFELYPQPLDRELAHTLIDMGVYVVVGAHAHRVQHYEMYKGHPIVYGLGNFMFSRKTFFNHKLDFGERSREEIALELKADGAFAIHKFEYLPEQDKVSFKGTEVITASSNGNAPYEGMSSDQYIFFFKENRIQKKFLPIFYFNDSCALYNLKCRFVAFRGWIISSLAKIGAKSQKRK